MRPSASASDTCSFSPIAVTFAVMIATASSNAISGPPNAKQSSDNCAIRAWPLSRHSSPDREGGNVSKGLYLCGRHVMRSGGHDQDRRAPVPPPAAWLARRPLRRGMLGCDGEQRAMTEIRLVNVFTHDGAGGNP